MFVGEGPWSFHRGNRKFLLVCLISRWCNFSSQRFRNWVDIDPKYAPSARSCTASSTRGGRGQVCCPCSLRIRTFSWSTSPSSHFPLFASLFSISRVWSWCRFQPQKSYGKGACCLLFHRSFLFWFLGSLSASIVWFSIKSRGRQVRFAPVSKAHGDTVTLPFLLARLKSARRGAKTCWLLFIQYARSNGDTVLHHSFRSPREDGGHCSFQLLCTALAIRFSNSSFGSLSRAYRY